MGVARRRAAVEVTLSEWSVANQPGSVPAGSTTFTVTNDGPDDVHEFVVIKTISMTELPADETGAVDELAKDQEIRARSRTSRSARPRS